MKYRSEVLLYSTIFDFHKIWEIWGKGFYLWVSSMKYVCIHLYIITGAWLLVYVSWFSLSVYSSVNYYLTHIRFPTVWYTGPVVYVLIGKVHSLWNTIDLLSVIQTCFSCWLIHDHCLCVQNGQTCIYLLHCVRCLQSFLCLCSNKTYVFITFCSCIIKKSFCLK